MNKKSLINISFIIFLIIFLLVFLILMIYISAHGVLNFSPFKGIEKLINKIFIFVIVLTFTVIIVYLIELLYFWLMYHQFFEPLQGIRFLIRNWKKVFKGGSSLIQII